MELDVKYILQGTEALKIVIIIMLIDKNLITNSIIYMYFEELFTLEQKRI